MLRRHSCPALLFLTSLVLLGCQPTDTTIIDPLPDPIFSGSNEISYIPPRDRHSDTTHGSYYPRTTISRAPWRVTNLSKRWDYIIIHHSATNAGGAVRFNKSHVQQQGMDELGYHFVIGNGTDTPVGKIEVGSRWPKQKHGAHCRVPGDATNKYNNHGIGICLVGDFDHEKPSQAQIKALVYLTKGLMDYTGLPASAVHYHKDFKPTDCPGRLFPYRQFEQAIRK